MSINPEFMANAHGSFMTIRVQVKRWEGVRQSKKVAQAAADAAGAEAQALGGHIKLMGVHHAELKAVKAAGAKINTYLYDHALPTEVDGEYMFHVDQIPQVVADLAKLKAEAEAVLEAFLPRYDNYVSAAKAHLKVYGEGTKYPTADEVRAKFAITISAPDFVPVADLERFKHLPLAQAAEWAEAAQAKVAHRIEGAREFILDSTRQYMADLEDSLSAGTYRVTDKKVKQVQHLSTQLRQLVRDWDNDPRLTALAELIDEQIAPTIKDLTKSGPTVHRSVRRAAKTVVKGIDDHKKNTAKLKASAPVKSAAVQGEAVGGGMLADLV